ncbi:hypothetical protein [Simkania negevensis]|uniref:Uncharacterized protein n=1 Tax=Simkania negevensis (strain ATCC VR-1471 / DSM 27360 / Z) TaxID=331113 RepID=F8L3H2_SIMNZ|nr:hypothetical protein [Simkania negevensis]CCB89830.1 unknown protein [Simkania negevensis Z]
MTGLSITVANIRSQIPGFVDILDSDGGVADVTLKGLEPHLEKMVSPDGMNCVIDGRPTKYILDGITMMQIESMVCLLASIKIILMEFLFEPSKWLQEMKVVKNFL